MTHRNIDWNRSTGSKEYKKERRKDFRIALEAHERGDIAVRNHMLARHNATLADFVEWRRIRGWQDAKPKPQQELFC